MPLLDTRILLTCLVASISKAFASGNIPDSCASATASLGSTATESTQASVSSLASRTTELLSGASTSASASRYTNAAYFVPWAIYDRNFRPQQLPASQLTHVIYAFADIKSNGTVYLPEDDANLRKHFETDSWEQKGNNAYGCVKQLYILKKHNRKMKVLLSIGGWTYSGNFSTPLRTSTGRKLFVSTAVTLLKDLAFDGIDIDWEFPDNEEEAKNFVLLLTELRSALDKYAKEHAPGYRFLITVGSPASPENYRKLHLKEMAEYLDAWFLIAYDYAGSWDDLTGHNANLFPSESIPDSTPFSTDKAITDYIAAGVPANKIVMGIPLYGRSFQQTTGPGKPFRGVGSPDFQSGSFDAGTWAYKVLPKAGATELLDPESLASYSYDSTTTEFISYDNVKEAEIKATYIRNKGLGGAMYWESSGDKNGPQSLIRTIAGSFGKLDESKNQLEYPASQYDNIKARMPGE